MSTEDLELARHCAASETSRQALHYVLVLAGVTFALAQVLLVLGIATPSLTGRELLASLQMFVAQDRLAAPLSGGVILGAWLLASRTRLASILQLSEVGSSRLMLIFALMGSTSAWLIGRLVFRGYGLSMDEFMPQFQAGIFRNGHLLEPISADLVPLHRRLQPFFVYVDEARGLWASGYRPGHALLLAMSPSIGGVNLLNPLLTGLSVLAAGDIARRLWPEWSLAPVLAALLLLVSPQVLLTAGSGFAYPAHLAFNLLWQSLFLRGLMRDRWGPHLAAALVGAFAIGLHQVHVHPLFAAPFLALLLLGAAGRRAHVLPYVVAYGLALPVWVLWPEIGVWLQTGDASALPHSLAEVHYVADFLRYSKASIAAEAPYNLWFLAANILRFVVWLSPALVLLVIVGLRRPRKLSAIQLAALASVLLTIMANHILMANQMQSWGSRYYHPVIGNLLMLALAGADLLRQGAGKRLFETALLLVVASALVLVPLRLVQVERKVAPRAVVQAAISRIDADVVIVPPLDFWFLADFIRNDADLTNRPLIMAGTGQGQGQGQEDWPGNLGNSGVWVLTEADMFAFGLPRGTLYEPGPIAD